MLKFFPKDTDINKTIRSYLSNNFKGITGGTIVTSGDNVYHIFTSPGPFDVGVEQSFEVLMIGGGGAGGSTSPNTGSGQGGGGAGGILHGITKISAGSYSIVVGSGGSATTSLGNGAPGGDTTFSTYTAFGGGGGGYQLPNATQSGDPGGSGGGASGSEPFTPSAFGGLTIQTPSGTLTGYGNSGGDDLSGGTGDIGSGGGGAGGVGGDSAPGGPAGNGGNGHPFSNFPSSILAPAFPAPWATAVGPTGLYG
jgi:hypothetical protein